MEDMRRDHEELMGDNREEIYGYNEGDDDLDGGEDINEAEAHALLGNIDSNKD